jgi:hypothetical protein
MVALMKASFPAMPHMPFFRHHKTRRHGIQANTAFGRNYLYECWKRASKAVGVTVDLYGGTRHSTATAFALEAGEENAKALTGHETNKAFWRYCQTENARALEMAERVRQMQGKVLTMKQAKK